MEVTHCPAVGKCAPHSGEAAPAIPQLRDCQDEGVCFRFAGRMGHHNLGTAP
jgi:hypothetical protein